MLLLTIMGCDVSSIKNTVVQPQATDSGTMSTDSSPPVDFNWDSVDVERANQHLEALNEIAIDNGGNRAAGTTGYDASVEYVKDILTSAGYTVSEWPFSFSQYQVLSDPELTVGFATFDEISVFYYSPAGTVEAIIEPVNLMIPPGNESNSSSSGCDSSDFSDFTSGNIALIQRGTCTFREKVENAQNAGASAVIIFNEGQNGRQEVLDGTLGDPAGLTIPAIGTSYAVGASLAAQAGSTAQLVVDSSTLDVTSVNVFAERSVGDPTNKIIVGAHLDSVQRGPGINDNGSGVASQLVLAEKLNDEGHVPNQRIQFAFWGAEELGLIGSYRFVESLSDQERQEIKANLNFDMIASPNFVRFIYDGDGSSFGSPGPEGSDLIEKQFENFYTDLNLSYKATAFDGRSDYGPFIMAGIPAGGLFSGAEGVKSEDEAEYGGTIGEAYDACYHLECDTRLNINTEGYREMMGAMFEVVKWASESDALLQSSKSDSGRNEIILEKRGCHYVR